MSLTYQWETPPSTPEPWVPNSQPNLFSGAIETAWSPTGSDAGNSGVRKTPDLLTDPVAARFFGASQHALPSAALSSAALYSATELLPSLDITKDPQESTKPNRWRSISLVTFVLGSISLGAFVWHHNGGVIPKPAPVGSAVAVLPSSVPHSEPSSVLNDAIPKNPMQVAPSVPSSAALVSNSNEAESSLLGDHDVPTLLARAETLRSSGGLNDAETIYRHLTLIVPRNPHAWSGLAEVLLQTQRYAEAALCAEQAVRLRPSRRSYQRLRDSIRAAERSHLESASLP